MKKIGTITIDGKVHQLQEARYQGDRVAILIDEGRWGKLTVYVASEHPPAPGFIHVKMWEENARLRDPALATGMFTDTGLRVPCGYVQAEVWEYRSKP